MGDVIGDLNSRRGMVNKFDDKPGGMKLVQAYVPLAEMFNYVSTLRGMTKVCLLMCLLMCLIPCLLTHMSDAVFAGVSAGVAGPLACCQLPSQLVAPEKCV